MKFILVALITLATLATVISSATAFQCYQCLFIVGDLTSDMACQHNDPGAEFLVNCTRTNANNFTGFHSSSSLLANPDSKANGDFLCLKSGGKLNGTDFVMRSCGEALVDEDLNGRCEVSTEDQLTPPYGTIAKGAKTFVCTSERCNTGPVNEVCETVSSTTIAPSTTTPAGASANALTSYFMVLLVVAKFVF